MDQAATCVTTYKSSPDWSAGKVVGSASFVEQASRPVVRLEPAEAEAKLIIVCQGDLRISSVLGGATTSCLAFLIGPGHPPLVSSHDGNLACVEVLLAPWATAFFFGASAVSHAMPIDLADLWPSRAGEFIERVVAAADGPIRLTVVDDFLRQAACHRHAAVPAAILWAWRELARSDGRRPIARLALEIGWSDRHFAAQFTASIGLRPKAFARRLRFASARRRLDAALEDDLCQVAARCGYADQSQMAREFRELAGCSPSAYRGSRLHNLPGTSIDALGSCP